MKIKIPLRSSKTLNRAIDGPEARDYHGIQLPMGEMYSVIPYISIFLRFRRRMSVNHVHGKQSRSLHDLPRIPHACHRRLANRLFRAPYPIEYWHSLLPASLISFHQATSETLAKTPWASNRRPTQPHAEHRGRRTYARRSPRSTRGYSSHQSGHHSLPRSVNAHRFVSTEALILLLSETLS